MSKFKKGDRCVLSKSSCYPLAVNENFTDIIITGATDDGMLLFSWYNSPYGWANTNEYYALPHHVEHNKKFIVKQIIADILAK